MFLCMHVMLCATQKEQTVGGLEMHGATLIPALLFGQILYQNIA